MDAAGPAARSSALEAELAAKTSRIADLEARVSLLYAENARLRKALAKGEGTDRAGEEDPKFGRLAAGLGGNKHEAVEKQDGSVACDVIEVSDGEEGMAIGVNEGRGPEEGVVAVPTPRKRAVRVVTGESEDVEDADGGSGSDKGSARCNSDAGLEDDDVPITARCKKRAAARVVTSDSEDEDENGGELGSDEDDEHDKEGGVTPSRKRALRGFSDSENEDGNEGVHVVRLEPASLVVATHIESGEEDEDDSVPICQALKKMRKKRVRDGDDDELGEAEGCSTPATRRLARLVKNQSKEGRAARRVLDFVEPKEYEGSEGDMGEDNDMDEFINDDDSLENATDSAEVSCAEPEVSDVSARNEESSPEPEESDSEINYAEVMACIGLKRNSKDWEHEGQMLSAFDKHPELCLKAVCALYRKQTEDERSEKATLIHNKEGFSQIDARRGSCIAEFLLDGDPYGPLKKTVRDLEEYDRYALEFCHKVAARYSKQLCAIYQNKEDPYFRP